MPRAPEELPLSGQKPLEDDVRQELQDHIDRRMEELVERGWSPVTARAEAERAFGDLRSVTAECRDITSKARRARRRSAWIAELSQDLRFAMRVLRRSPTFAVVAIVTLALGVGANTAVFSLINSVLLRPLPYPRGDRLADVVELHTQGWAHPSYSNFVDLRAQTRRFASMAGYFSGPSTLLGGDQPMRVNSASVTTDFFRVMQARPERGRLTTPADHRLGAVPVVVVSDRFWRDHLGANPDLASLRLRGEFDFQVVGVLPPGFNYPDNVDLWQPLELDEMPPSRTAHGLRVIGRLKDGIAPVAAQRDLDAVMRHVGETAGADFDAVGTRVTSMRADLTGAARTPLLLLLGASALLLLTACTNLASTLLARGTARAPEIAIRTSIGAGRGRIARQILAECLVIACAGCVVGLGLAQVLLRGVASVAPAELGVLHGVSLDWHVLTFTALIALATALIFGALPALRLSRVDAGTLMRGGLRGGSARRGPIWSALVIIEVAMAVVLLVGSGLLLRSFAQVTHVDLGFDPDHVLTVAIDLPELNYPSVAQAVAFHDRALELVRAIPGVQAAGVTNVLPTEGDGPDGGIEVEGHRPTSPAHPATGYATYRLASTGFFTAMRMRIVRGRDFTESDQATSPLVVVVNQALAEKEWPGENPLGKRMRASGMDAVTEQPWATVVGVVDNVPGSTTTGIAPETYYYSYRQLPYRARSMQMTIRSAQRSGALAASVRAAIARADPAAPMEFRTMNDVVASSTSSRRFMALLLSLFAAIALVLAAVGIYGVVSWSVAQRTREIGIRIALGAAPASVSRAIQGSAMGVVLLGTGLGVGAAWGAARLLRSLLYQVAPTDPIAFGGVVLLLVGTAVLASWVPARRSARIDPLSAIRAE